MPRTKLKSIAIGNSAGHHFSGQGDLTVAYHAVRVDRQGKIEEGFFMKRKWLCDRAAFNYDPTMGWAYEHWFDWPADRKTQ